MTLAVFVAKPRAAEMKELQGESMMEQNLATYLFAEKNIDENLVSVHHVAKELIPENNIFMVGGDDGDNEFMDSLLRFADDEGDDTFSTSSLQEYDDSLLPISRMERNAIVEESNSVPFITNEDPPFTPFASIGFKGTSHGFDQAVEHRKSEQESFDTELADHMLSQLKRLTESMRRSEVSRAKLIPIKRAIMAQQRQDFIGFALKSLMKPSQTIYWNG